MSPVFLRVLTVGEPVRGIALMPAGQKQNHLTNWIAGIESECRERILPLHVETARIWGELTARAHKKGIIIPRAEGLLAATVLQHGLHVMI